MPCVGFVYKLFSNFQPTPPIPGGNSQKTPKISINSLYLLALIRFYFSPQHPRQSVDYFYTTNKNHPKNIKNTINTTRYKYGMRIALSNT
jgi:hypothetical protein